MRFCMPAIKVFKSNIIRKDSFKQRAINSEDGRYSTKAWRDKRAIEIKEEPFCVECLREGKPKHKALGSVRDHIHPVNQGGDFWDRNNIQTLCKSHHNSKSGREAHSKY